MILMRCKMRSSSGSSSENEVWYQSLLEANKVNNFETVIFQGNCHFDEYDSSRIKLHSSMAPGEPANQKPLD